MRRCNAINNTGAGANSSLLEVRWEVREGLEGARAEVVRVFVAVEDGDRRA